MTHLPLELISILNLMRINFFIGQAPDTQSDTTDIRLISVHVLRTELQVSMGSAAGGGAAAPQILEKSFSI